MNRDLRRTDHTMVKGHHLHRNRADPLKPMLVKNLGLQPVDL
jgi:hypothetical protein